MSEDEIENKYAVDRGVSGRGRNVIITGVDFCIQLGSDYPEENMEYLVNYAMGILESLKGVRKNEMV